MKTLFALLCLVSFGANAETYIYGPGVHTITNQLILSDPHSVLQGAGRGVTILKVPKGVLVRGADSIVRDLTITGSYTGTGLTLRDAWATSVQNVEIENFATGLVVELTDEGRSRAGGVTLNKWPIASTPGNWGSRVTLTEIRDVEVTGYGDGIVLRNTLKHSTPQTFYRATDELRNGEFFTGTSIIGGHVKVDGQALRIGDGVWGTKLIGAYFDVGVGGGVLIEYGAQFVNILATNVDLSSSARAAGVKKVVSSTKSSKSLLIVGCDELTMADVQLTTDPT